MKHIKTYQVFESSSESPEEIVKYLEDIFQELKDMGFTCKVDVLYGLDIKTDDFTININYNGKGFKYNLIKDYIESATDYMDSIGYRIGKTKEWIRYFWKKIDLSLLSINDDEIKQEISIIYKPKL